MGKGIVNRKLTYLFISVLFLVNEPLYSNTILKQELQQVEVGITLEQKLFDAVEANDEERFMDLEGQGVNIFARDENGRTILHVAASLGLSDVVAGIIAIGLT